MPDHDMNIANDSGANVRTDLNNALSALVQLSSGAAEPSTMFAHMFWADTTPPAGNTIVKMRNNANSAWVTMFDDEGRWRGQNGDATDPSLSFGLDTNTGFYRSAADNVSLTLGGTRRYGFEADNFTLISTSNPRYSLVDSGASANEGWWSIRNVSGLYQLRAIDDADSGGNAAFSIARSATTVGMITMSGTGLTMTGATIHTPVTITTDTTPTAVGRRNIIIGAWTAANDITDFDNETAGQRLTILGGDSDCNVVDGAPIQLVSGTTWNGAAGATLELISDGTVWYELSRSDAS